MLVEIAIGDAYGAGFEFSERAKIQSGNTLTSYFAHELGIRAGCYTDDTQMSIAVSEVLLEPSARTSDAFADAFVRCFKRDPRKGYSKGLQVLLQSCNTGRDLSEQIHPVSRRNGAAMRAVPLGLIEDKKALRLIAAEQARITHNTREGILSAQVVALMTHFMLYHAVAVSELPSMVMEETGFELMSDWSKEVECDAIQTLHAVNTALLRNRTMSSLLQDCVNFGGDVDSVAAIAMGMASVSSEYSRDVPAKLVEGLENDDYGRDFLGRLDAELALKFPILNGKIF